MPHSIQAKAPYLAFPVLMGSSVAITYYGSAYLGISPFLLGNLVAIALSAVVFGLERWIPHRQDWNRMDGQELNDIGHSIFGTGFGAFLGDRLVQLWMLPVGLWMAERWQGGLWPGSAPFWLQLLLVFLLADLGRYWQHRLLHTVPFLWRIHSLHHSGEKLNVFKTSRSHILERIMQQLFMFSALALIGAPAEVILWYVIPNSFLGILAHCNVDQRLGWIEYVVMGPGAHRIHHSEDMREGNSNFGSSMVIWDHVFGTYISPVGRSAPPRMGIPNDDTPRGFIAQVIQPFRS